MIDAKHALAVAQQLGDPGSESWLAGLLHDAIEDGDVDYADLVDAKIPEAARDAVYEVTRRKDETYGEYIDRIATSGNRLAMRLKIADLSANLDRMDDAHATLGPRYEKALDVLCGAKRKAIR